ncbi:MAG TPA: rod shape-determining protein RodA [Gammaproteobacteria bacterium]|nr:rod shape-determining protein RodA [Gammaproteobacteria bacterium]
MEEKTLAKRLHIDVPLLFGLLVLCGIGLVVLYSAAGQDLQVVFRQAIRMGIALVLMFCVAQFSPIQLERWSLWIYLGGVSLLVAVLLFGDVGKGAQRWLDLGFFRFQPSEIMKLAVPMVIAWFLAGNHLPPTIGRIIFSCVLVIVPVVLIAKQPDLGTALLVGAAGFSVLFISGIGWRFITGFSLIIALCAPVLWHFMHEYQKRRVLTFLDPEQDPLGAGYHTIQSKIAIGSGGLYGKGWLNGTQSHLEFLPERSTDFIFAVFCEEFGLMGVLLLIVLYMFIIFRGLIIAVSAQQTYGKLLAAGFVMTFFVYVFVNMGMVTGQLPVVGVPLPMISLGGTSIVTLMIAFGILMSINTHRRMLSD